MSAAITFTLLMETLRRGLRSTKERQAEAGEQTKPCREKQVFGIVCGSGEKRMRDLQSTFQQTLSLDHTTGSEFTAMMLLHSFGEESSPYPTTTGCIPISYAEAWPFSFLFLSVCRLLASLQSNFPLAQLMACRPLCLSQRQSRISLLAQFPALLYRITTWKK